MTEKEKALVEAGRKMWKALKGNSKSTLVESKDMMIDSLKVKIRRYQDASAAQIDFEKNIKSQERQKQRALERNYLHTEITYFLNSPFILQIYHYEVDGPDAFRPTSIDVSIDSVERIKEAFEKF